MGSNVPLGSIEADPEEGDPVNFMCRGKAYATDREHCEQEVFVVID